MNRDADTDRLLENASWVRGLARHLLADPDAAEDVAQETSIAVWSRGGQGPGLGKPWLARVARNFALQRRREDASRGRRERAVAKGESLPSTDEVVARAELHARLVATVLALEEPHRSMLLWRYFEELDPGEIARRARVEPATVRSRLKRARERLRAELERRGGAPEGWLVALAGWRAPGAGGASAGTGAARPEVAVSGGAAAGTVVVMSIATKVGLATAAALAGVLWWSNRGSEPAATTRPGIAASRSLEGADAISADSSDRLGTDPDSRNALAPEALAAPTVVAPADLVRGVVLGDGNRAPLAGARIGHHLVVLPGSPSGLAGSGQRSAGEATAGADGRFEIARPRELDHGLRVELEGWFPFEVAHDELPREPGSELEIVLAPLGRIDLSVSTETGAPVAGARVFWSVDLTRGSNAQRWAGRVDVPAGETDAAGNLAVAGIPCGMPVRLARKRSAASYDAGADWLGTVVVDPRLRSLRHDARITTKARIAGRLVSAADGSSQAPSDRVLAWHRRPVDSWERVWTRSDAEGRFELAEIPPASGELRVDVVGFEPIALELRPGETRDLGTIELPRTVRLSGRLVSRFALADTSYRVLVYRGARELEDLSGATFACDVTPGPLTLEVAAATSELRFARIELAEPAENLEIPIDVGCGGVQVRFVDPPRSRLGWTALVRSGERWRSAGSGGADAGASVVLGPFPPGTYRVSLRELEPDDRPRALTREVEVLAGAIADAGEVSFARFEAAVRVVDGDGTPVEHASVSLRSPGQDSHATQVTDEEGWARFEGVECGFHDLAAGHGDAGRASREAVLIEASSEPILLTLAADAAIEGVLSNGSGPARALAVHVQPHRSNDVYSATTDSGGRFRIEGLPAGRVRLWVNEFAEILDLAPGQTRRIDATLGSRRRYRFLREGAAVSELRGAYATPFDADALARRRWSYDHRGGDSVELALEPGLALFAVSTLDDANGALLALADASHGTVELARGAVEIATRAPWTGSLPRATLESIDGREVVGGWGSAIELVVELDGDGRARVPCVPPGARVRLRGVASDGRTVDLEPETSPEGRARVDWP